MPLEALLAYGHILAILMAVTFLASETALCRAEWMNAAVVERLVRLDLLWGISALCVLASGLARSYWGMKGADWYWAQPLLHAKLTLFVLVALLSLLPTRRFLQWRRTLRATGALPSAEALRATRRLVMIEAHALVLLPLLGVLLARGIGTR
ncbi:DUF2214 family protein [Acidovorax sp. HDW3]|uniref:DUF2214 family protein n=1 Tax=Acidovorax sp. HDW3 TaxID=2714923 RepID=UPI00140D9160|nr:DUF2214 family protein [Acidovorax sp. HDW3]QIL45129.1 DUF2214 family protein [Acidovorax sp. HDW3]